MPKTNFRALCAELRAIIPAHGTGDPNSLVTARADAALAQPAPVAPTDEDLYDLAEVFNGEPVAAMRRALELWGHPAPPAAG